jgi:antitoxin ChpS
MAAVKLRQVGGSLSFAVPPSVKDALGLAAGAVLEVEVVGGSLVAKPARPRYTIEELIALCSPDDPYSDEAREWIDAPAVGRELL